MTHKLRGCFIAAISLIILGGLGGAALAQTICTPIARVKVDPLIAGVNVRSEPRVAEGNVVAGLKPADGEKSADDESGGWWHVCGLGWANGKYLSVVRLATAAPTPTRLVTNTPTGPQVIVREYENFEKHVVIVCPAACEVEIQVRP